MLDQVCLAKAGQAPVVVALSGGGDSTALLHLLHEAWGPARLHACVVDHGLRAGSDADAARAARIAGRLGVAVEVRQLEWNAGETRSQDAARAKRYAALAQAARASGSRFVTLAHTADDQAETVFMRAAKASHWRGLAGMAAVAPLPAWPEGRGLWALRPLLGARRAQLRAALTVRGAHWIEDPANLNTAFERVRVRARLAALESVGFDPMRLAALARRLRVLADEIDAAAAALIEAAVRFEEGEALVSLAAWRGDAEARGRALSVLVAAIAGAAREPDSAGRDRLEAQFAAPDFRGAALGGVVLRRRDGEIRVSRDVGAIQGRPGGPAPMAEIALIQSQDIVWDGRLELRAHRSGLTLAPGLIPAIRHGEIAMPLAQAVAAGAIAARWLAAERVRQMLGQAEKAVAFTPA